MTRKPNGHTNIPVRAKTRHHPLTGAATGFFLNARLKIFPPAKKTFPTLKNSNWYTTPPAGDFGVLEKVFESFSNAFELISNAF